MAGSSDTADQRRAARTAFAVVVEIVVSQVRGVGR
jgi:hypothetical protein